MGACGVSTGGFEVCKEGRTDGGERLWEGMGSPCCKLGWMKKHIIHLFEAVNSSQPYVILFVFL
jgi:hypothetical protein